MGLIYLVAAVVLGAIFLWQAYGLWRRGDVGGGVDGRRDPPLQVLDHVPEAAVPGGRRRRPGASSRSERPRLGRALSRSAHGAPLPRWRRRPSPARSTCSRPSGAQSSSTAACSRAARTRRSATGSRSPTTRATIDAILLTHAHLDHCGLIPHVWSRAIAARSTRPAARSSWPSSSCSTRASSRRSSPSARRAGSGATPTRSPRTTEGGRPATRRPSSWPTAGDAIGRPRRSDRTARRPRRAGSAASGEHVATSVEPARDRGGGVADSDAEAGLRAQPPDLHIDLDEPLYTAKDAERVAGQRSRRSTTARSSRSRRASTRRSSTPATSSARRSSGCPGRGAERRRSDADHRLLRRPRPAGHADPPRPDGPDRRRLRPRRVDLRRPRARAGGTRRSGSSPRPSGWSPSAGGVLLVPSFAIGRTQEIVWELDRLLEQGKIPLLPLYLDSPMASKASDIYRRHPDYYDEETREAAARRRIAARLSRTRPITHDVQASQAIATAPRPYMIVASNGMLTGGRVVGHLRNLIDDPDADAPVRRLPGGGDARGAPPGRRDDRQARRPGPRRSAARSARSAASRPTPTSPSCSTGWATSRRGKTPGDRRLPAAGLPRPRRPGGPGRAGAEGPGDLGFDDACPALARAGHPRLTTHDFGGSKISTLPNFHSAT